MNTRDPKLIALLFNECINNKDLDGLSQLMTDDHTFIDRDGNISRPKKVMIDGWENFFSMFPGYNNTFNRIESRENHVSILGYAYWSEREQYDPVIWTAVIVNDLVSEWRVRADSEENRELLNLI